VAIKIRVAGLLVLQGHVLLAKHRTHSFWILPGGKLDEGESLADCAERELWEETSLRVKAEDPLFLGDFVGPDRQVLDIVFRVRLDKEKPGNGLPPVKIGANDTNLAAVEWWPVDKPPKVGPRPLGDFLVRSKFDPDALRGRILYGGKY
jgi:ADP-ribose pyrophosphatase YjhB (NUDIX family)